MSIIETSKLSYFNPIPDDKILDLPNFRAFADDNVNVVQVMQSMIGWKTLWEKEKCWFPAFSPFPTMFSKGYCFQDRENPGLFGKGLRI